MNRVLRRILGPKREEITEDWREGEEFVCISDKSCKDAFCCKLGVV